MSAFREYVPLAHDLLHEAPRRVGVMDEMRAYAGAADVEDERYERTFGDMRQMRALAEGGFPIGEWGDMPATGPTGPRALGTSPRGGSGFSQPIMQPSPRAVGPRPSAVANDPGAGRDWTRGARAARIAFTRQSAEEDGRAILSDPRVQQSLRTVHRLVQDMDHLVRQHQDRLESLRLQVAHLLTTAARSPDQASQLRENVPKLAELLRDIHEGNPGQGYRAKIQTALAELEYAGVGPTPFGSATF